MSERVELKCRLREALELREKKAADLARDLKISKSAISQYLSGDRTIRDSERLFIISKYLNVSEAWLMGFDVPMERHLEKIEENPEEEGNKLGDMYMELESKEEGSDEFCTMIEEYKQLDEVKKAQVREYVHLLLGSN